MMGDVSEYEHNEHSPLLNNERSIVTANYKGAESQGTETVTSDEPEGFVSHEEEHHTQIQQAEASRHTGPTVTCRVCSATIVIEGKVKKFAFRHS